MGKIVQKLERRQDEEAVISMFSRIKELLGQRSFPKNVELIICGARTKGIIGWKPFRFFLFMPIALPVFVLFSNFGGYVLGLFSAISLFVFELYWIPHYTKDKIVFWRPTIKKYSLEIEVIFWFVYIVSIVLSAVVSFFLF